MNPLTLRHEIDEVLHNDTVIVAFFEVDKVEQITILDYRKTYEDGEICTIFYAPTDSVRFMWE